MLSNYKPIKPDMYALHSAKQRHNRINFKVKSRVSPPTSPTSLNNEEAISKKLAEAEERKKSLEQERAKRLASQLERVSLAKEKKGKKEEKFTAEVMEKIESKKVHAEEIKRKQMEEFKGKVFVKSILSFLTLYTHLFFLRCLNIPPELRRRSASWRLPLRLLRPRHRRPSTRG